MNRADCHTGFTQEEIYRWYISTSEEKEALFGSAGALGPDTS